ncbi:hypothetical protein KOR34_13470 [Posidoniimonas corsicana]|uniref:Uncharacterized protein n=1 Tax=Posidoniimonas corsicana TaxID=1938618 RepID=A0A5C5VFL2_9BACT|nr:hypothetical protein [Posidoniimonas corsicana]TWT36442.1 hypothetical protein KOR34_13470 [Posidoniimonas corsicana]
MRIYHFFSTMLLAGVVTVGVNAQDGIEDIGGTLSRGANDLAGKAQVTGDAVRDTARNTAQATRDAVGDARRGAAESLDNARRDVRESTQDARERSRNLRPRDLDANARSRASVNFDDADRNADWRFVERNGAWWYRTPMNTWMVQRDGRWVNYQGANQRQYGQQGYADSQVVTSQYENYQARTGNTQAGYDQEYQNDYANQQASYNSASQSQSQVGHQEWMCIDGRRRLVTVTSVRTIGDSREAGTMDQGQRPQPADRQDGTAYSERDSQRYTAARPLTPPPAPSADRAVNRGDNVNVPAAPSREAIMGAAAGAGAAAAIDSGDNDRWDADADAEARTDAAVDEASAEAGAEIDANGEAEADLDMSDSAEGATPDVPSNTDTDAPLDMNADDGDQE